MLKVNESVSIPLREFEFSFARSGGPGGQNVNKVNTKACLKWNLERTTRLPNPVKERFQKKYRRRINSEGELVLFSQRFRDQGRNVADCIEKLREMLQSVAEAPKVRKPTRKSKGSNERRLKQKKERAQIKTDRQFRGARDQV